MIFEASDGEVSAHDHALAVASPVLKAMLESAMKEGTSRRIQSKDSSASGVSLFLDPLYTSSTREDPDHRTMLEALDSRLGAPLASPWCCAKGMLRTV